ncbi:MAG: OmpA family protein [Bacteroidia bacterium]
MKMLLLLAVVVLAPSLIYAQGEVIHHVYFEFDKHSLKTQEVEALDQFIEQYQASGAEKLIIHGHTDSFGTDGYNLILSLRRTSVVQQYLEKQNIPSGEIDFSSFGETKPLVANSTNENRQKNRRVELAYKVPVIPQTAEVEVSPEEECPPRVIEGAKGSQIIASCDCFDGIDVNEIEVKITEVNTPAEMIEEDIITVDALGNCLETGGMIFVEILHKGQPVKASNDTCMKVRIPAPTIDPEMRLYQTRKMGGLTGWSSESQKLDFTVENGRSYYEFNITGGGGFNADKVLSPVALVSAPVAFVANIIENLKNDGLVVKTRKYRISMAYLTNTSGNTMDKGRKLTFRKVGFRDCFRQPDSKVMITLAKNGETYMVEKQLSDLRYKRFWRKYVVKAGDIEPDQNDVVLQGTRVAH